MKKFMVLALLVAMASIVNAGASLAILDASGDGVIDEGEVVTINWMEDGAEVKGFAALVVDVEAGTYVPDSFKAPVAGGLLSTLAVTEDGTGLTLAGGIIYFPGTQAPADGIVLSLQFAAPTVGEYAIDVTGVYGTDEQSGLSTSFVVVPEPMTLGLLSLGGLFLRRRK